MSDYRPIACHLHDQYEIAILRRQSLEVELFVNERWSSEIIWPIDLKVEQGQEFLLYRVSGQSDVKRIRLDEIKLINQSS